MSEEQVVSSEVGKEEKLKKIKKILVIVLLALLALIVLLAVVLAPVIVNGNKVIVRDTAEPSYELENWMSYISDDAPVTSVAIPGAHDSGCYDEMNYVAATQDLSLADQLARGVRYFDIRINNSKDGLVVYHSIVNGVPYTDLLEDISEFFFSHPEEFLILDFQHFKNDSEEQVFAMLEEAIGTENFVVNDTELGDAEFVDSLTVGDVRGKCFIYYDPEETDYEGGDYLFQRGKDLEEFPELSLISLYKRGKNGRAARAFAEKVLPGYVEEFREDFGKGFFVLQAQLTDTTAIFGPRYREGRGIEHINNFVKGLVGSEMLKDINIVMRDFVTCEKSAITVSLNLAKGFVKSELAAEFEQAMAAYIG